MQIYLAARYTRRSELCKYRKQLQELGHNVQARWLDGKHQINDLGSPIGDLGEQLIEGGHDSLEACALRSKFALEDFEDCTSADTIINFTEPPRSNNSRGGRHVECGMGLAVFKRTIVVGHRENLFHWLPCVEFYPSWEEALSKLRGIDSWS